MNYLSLPNSIEEILDKYPLPQRFLAYFASQVAKDALSKVSNPDPRSLAAVDMAEAYGNGEDFTEEHKNQVTDDAYTAATSSAYAPHTTHYSSFSAAHAAAAALSDPHVTAVSHAARAAAAALSYPQAAAHVQSISQYYKPLLLSLIESRLTELEKVLIFN